MSNNLEGFAGYYKFIGDSVTKLSEDLYLVKRAGLTYEHPSVFFYIPTSEEEILREYKKTLIDKL